jgi:hypothetical protein
MDPCNSLPGSCTSCPNSIEPSSVGSIGTCSFDGVDHGTNQTITAVPNNLMFPTTTSPYGVSTMLSGVLPVTEVRRSVVVPPQQV